MSIACERIHFKANERTDATIYNDDKFPLRPLKRLSQNVVREQLIKI